MEVTARKERQQLKTTGKSIAEADDDAEEEEDSRSSLTKGAVVAGNGEEKVQLKRKITLLNAIALVIGTIIGSGIFVSPKGVYMNAGESIYGALAIWTFCGIFSMLGSLCFSELGTTITRSGGEYAYVLEAFGPLTGFLNLWVQLLVIRPTTQAISAITFALYVTSPFFEDCEPPPLLTRVVAACSICLLTFVNCRSVRWSMNVQGVFMFAKLLAVFVIIIFGFVNIAQESKPIIPYDENAGKIGLKQIAHSIYSGLFAYGGWNYINVVTEELKNPYRNLPRAAIAGILAVTAVYVLANVAYFAVLTTDEIKGSTAVAAKFTEKVLPSSAKWFLPVAVAVSTFGGLNGILFTTARLFYVASQERQVPLVMGMISVQRSTPVPSLLTSCVVTLLMLVQSDIYALINYFSFTLWLWTGVATAALIYLRFAKPDIERPIKFPLFLPVIFTAGCLILTLFAIYSDPVSAAYGSLLFVVGIPVFFLQRRHIRNLAASGSRPGLLTTLVQKVLLVSSPDEITASTDL